MLISDRGDDFIELHRTFHELAKHSRENDDSDVRWASPAGDRLSWFQIIKEYRLIILSEAGSGKTAEIRNIAHILRKEGKPAFFLRLEHLPGDFEDAFEVGTYKDFREWLASGTEGWLLLDSVDEARLRSPGDFELAIRKLSNQISTAKDRTHLVITGRTTAWRPKTDLAYCAYHLPYAAAATTVTQPQDEDDKNSGIMQTKTDSKSTTQSSFKIVALDELDAHQIAVFVDARGIESKSFLEAIERADAWSFTSRPQDLQELAEFWIDKGRIGTRLELMRNSIDRRLTERDQGRADARPLSEERARQGARLLAAAAILAQNPTIRVPDGAENSPGISVQFVLAEWDNRDQSTLLSRPIFDEAIYGEVRFHHRSVREYLAAEWFAELLKRETSRRNVESLFFCNQYGLDIVVPTLRQILPWLALLDEKIMARIRKVAPEIILEGGDPSQLPLDVRRSILYEVCEQMAEGAAGRTIHDHAAVQRFANPDLTDDVRILIRKYADNNDLTAFLLHMVWLGPLPGAQPETMNVALAPSAERYSRTTAFRAIKAIGCPEEQEIVRQSFLAEASELQRDWLAELLDDVHPTEQIVDWLIACLGKCEPNEENHFDHLEGCVTEFVAAADVELLPKVLSGLNGLLGLPPMIERRYCQVSAKFKSLLAPASRAVERLILARHPASLESDVLAVLHSIPALLGYGSHEQAELKANFSKIVPLWKDLNQALFWFEVGKARETADNKSKERLTEFWRVSLFGSFWRFEQDDFGYVVQQISSQALQDNKLVALSLAFQIYNTSQRPRPWIAQLKKMVAGNDELSRQLSSYLRPPAQSREIRRMKRQEAQWKKRLEANHKKQAQFHEGWNKYLSDKLEEARSALRDKPGVLINPLLYLFEQTRSEKSTTGRWTEYNWKGLIPKYGEEAARFYRDGAVAFWRHHVPLLRSEGATPNKTSYSIIIGLSGLEIEAHEIIDWPTKLSAEEVLLACKYASFELNGFPAWFPKLYEEHPKIVCEFLMQEIRYELSHETPEETTHYVLSDVSESGQWSWGYIAPSIYDILKSMEPKNLPNLEKLLKIVQGSSIPDKMIEALVSQKCRTLENPEHVAHWLAAWTGIAPEAAIPFLEDRLEKINDAEKQTFFAMTFIMRLCGSRRGYESATKQAFNTPEYLMSLYLLMHKYIRPREDINRAGSGVYSPELRDHAQDARGSLLDMLNMIPGKESFLALMDIAKRHPEETFRPLITRHAKSKAEQDGDLKPWSLSQIRDFHEKLERTPRNHRELAELAVLRFLDLKDDFENGDSSVAGILQTVEQETKMRNFIGRELRGKALGRYSISQEEEFADAKKPDLRFHGMGFDGPVPVELKLADNWTGPELFERMENQLCGDYLRDNCSTRGIFILVYRGAKTGWDVPSIGGRVNFAGLTAALQDHWMRVSPKFSTVDDIAVIGIDLTKRLT